MYKKTFVASPLSAEPGGEMDRKSTAQGTLILTFAATLSTKGNYTWS